MQSGGLFRDQIENWGCDFRRVREILWHIPAGAILELFSEFDWIYLVRLCMSFCHYSFWCFLWAWLNGNVVTDCFYLELVFWVFAILWFPQWSDSEGSGYYKRCVSPTRKTKIGDRRPKIRMEKCIDAIACWYLQDNKGKMFSVAYAHTAVRVQPRLKWTKVPRSQKVPQHFLWLPELWKSVSNLFKTTDCGRLKSSKVFSGQTFWRFCSSTLTRNRKVMFSMLCQLPLKKAFQ